MAILRRIKDKLTKISKRQGKAGIVKGERKKIRGKDISRVEKKEVLGAQETAVEKTKFYSPEAPVMPRVTPQDLPWGVRSG